MSTSIKLDDIDKVLAEADELVEKINSMVSEDVIETQKIEFEKRLKELETIRSKMKAKFKDENGSAEISSYAEGFHEAYQEITKAMKDLKDLLN
ncbi:MAG: hypothetical protein PVJ37_07600 [Desulfobacterales bacterium]|jgi:ribosomal protein S20